MAVQTADNTKAIVDKALSAVGDLATLPEVTIKIIEIVENAKSTARDLHGVIKNDPALSVKILKVVNSAFYGLPGQVASVDRAIILLGLSAVKNIAIAASIARLFKGKRISEQFTAADLWRHSLAVAVSARTIAKLSPHPVMADEVFVAGLIHDIGTLIERQSFPEQFAEVISHCAESGANFLATERRIIGADHQAFGVGLTTKWKFPRHLRAAVGFHHNPEALSVELRNMATLIRMADVLCCQEKTGFHLTAQNESVTDQMLDTISITREQLDSVRDTLSEQVAEAEATLTG
ncbi:MAG: HDOD domain-containing protein [Phycisphaerae bacterium]|jgi:putative nucleotidyltransferase with HDIG domain